MEDAAPASARFDGVLLYAHSAAPIRSRVILTPTAAVVRLQSASSALHPPVLIVPRSATLVAESVSQLRFAAAAESGPRSTTLAEAPSTINGASLRFPSMEERIRFQEAFTNRDFFRSVSREAERDYIELKERHRQATVRRLKEAADRNDDRERTTSALLARQRMLFADCAFEFDFNRQRSDFDARRAATDAAGREALESAARRTLGNDWVPDDARRAAFGVPSSPTAIEELENARARHRAIVDAEIASCLSSRELASDMRALTLSQDDSTHSRREQHTKLRSDVLGSIRRIVSDASPVHSRPEMEGTARAAATRAAVLQQIQQTLAAEREQRREAELKRAQAIIESSRLARLRSTDAMEKSPQTPPPFVTQSPIAPTGPSARSERRPVESSPIPSPQTLVEREPATVPAYDASPLKASDSTPGRRATPPAASLTPTSDIVPMRLSSTPTPSPLEANALVPEAKPKHTPVAAASPGPAPWQERVDEKSGRKFWFDPATKKTSWKNPSEAQEAASPIPTKEGPNSAPTQTSTAAPPWKEMKDAKSGRTYWYNTETKQTTWRLEDTRPEKPSPPPAAAAGTASAAPPNEEWVEMKDTKSGRPYWYNKATKKTTWNVADTQVAAAAPPAQSPTLQADPSPWKTMQDTKSGRTYWYNTVTRATTWSDPLQHHGNAAAGTDGKVPTETKFAKVAGNEPLPAPWRELKDEKSGRPYWYNPVTKRTTWKREEVV